MDFNRKQRFSIRKFSIGAASVLLGSVIVGTSVDVKADEVLSQDASSTEVKSEETSASTTQEVVASSIETVTPAEVKETTSPVYTPAAVVAPTAATPVTPETAEKTEEVNTEATSEKEVAASEGTTSFRNGTQATSRVVSNWNGFLSALQDSSIQNITISGNVVANGDNGNADNGRPNSVDRSVNVNSQGRALTIQGRDQAASLDLLSNTLNFGGSSAWNLVFKNLNLASANSKGAVNLSGTRNANTVTFENVNSKGSSLYGGGGNTAVVIKGNTTSTVSDSYRAANGQTQYVQRNVGTAGHSQQRREANIHDAKSVTVAEGASLTLNRSSQGDAINLAGGANIRVANKAALTINMNTNNGTENARYHNAAIFMEDGGNVVTGKDSKLVINSSIGQALSLGMKRPADGITALDRWGGYGTVNAFKKNAASSLTIGENGTFNFTGRDGLIFGNNASFTTGVNSKVHFENKGRGVAIDFGDNSHVVFGKNSTNTFHSEGKGPKSGGGPSGSYNAYNYIGVNENGTITVDDYATFRVQMDNRGDNAWDDVINLDSKSGRKERPLFQANKGSIVDIRDDNTNYYAELISVPLGNSTNTYFQFNNPLYVSFMRYTNSSGLSAGEITGKLPISTPQGNNPEQIGHGNILYISNGGKNTGNRVEFNGPNGSRTGAGTYTVYSMNRDGRDVTSRDKQSSVWMDIQGGAMSIAGFKPGGKAEINPSMATSVRTGSSSGGVLATDKTYGIDPVIANRQNIWISNGSSINPTATHQNVIRYVYEDGTPVLDENGQAKVVRQSSDWKRTVEIAIDQNQFKNVLKNSRVDNGDDFLAAYAKAEYKVRDIDGDGKSDTGWTLAGTRNSKATYDTVLSPELDGFKAEILSTNVPGLATGSDASQVTVTFNPKDIKDNIVVNQKISDTYWRNIVDNVELQNYETVIVYKLDKQKAAVKYVDITANEVLNPTVELEGRGGEAIDYSTASRIQEYRRQGYNLISDGFSESTDKVFDKDASVDQEFVVNLEQRVVPVGPNDPDPIPGKPVTPEDPAPWPDSVKTEVKTRRQIVERIVNYKIKQNGQDVVRPVKNLLTYERTFYVNLVTGNVTASGWRIVKSEIVQDEPATSSTSTTTASESSSTGTATPAPAASATTGTATPTPATSATTGTAAPAPAASATTGTTTPVPAASATTVAPTTVQPVAPSQPAPAVSNVTPSVVITEVNGVVTHTVPVTPAANKPSAVQPASRPVPSVSTRPTTTRKPTPVRGLHSRRTPRV